MHWRTSASATPSSPGCAKPSVVDEDTIDVARRSIEFSGSIWGYPEGEIYFPYSPVLIVEGTFAECVILETVFLSILNHDSAIASAASRMVSAAGDRPVHRNGLSAHARAVSGLRGARRVRGRLRRDVQSRGGPDVRHPDHRHERPLVHAAARQRARRVRGPGARPRPETTLLVDTYDIPEGVGLAVEVAGAELGGVRLDSGDLVSLAKSVRKQLDDLGVTVDPHHRDQRSRRARDRGAGIGARRRLRGRHRARDRFRRADQQLRLQAGCSRRRRRRDGVGRQGEQGQGLGRRTQIRTAPSQHRRRRPGRGHRHRRRAGRAGPLAARRAGSRRQAHPRRATRRLLDRGCRLHSRSCPPRPNSSPVASP